MLGIDPSQDMMALATRHHAHSGRANLVFAVADVRHLDFESGFDFVASFNALLWLPEQEVALRSIQRALNLGAETLRRFVPEGPRKCLEAEPDPVWRRVRW